VAFHLCGKILIAGFILPKGENASEGFAKKIFRIHPRLRGSTKFGRTLQIPEVALTFASALKGGGKGEGRRRFGRRFMARRAREGLLKKGGLKFCHKEELSYLCNPFRGDGGGEQERKKGR